MWSENTENSMISKISNTEKVKKSLKSRYLKEKIFKFVGLSSIFVAFFFLLILLSDVMMKAFPAFIQTKVELELDLSEENTGVSAKSDIKEIKDVDYRKIIREALSAEFPEVKKRAEKKTMFSIISTGAEFQLRDMIVDNPQLIGSKQKIELVADDNFDALAKGQIDLTGEQKRFDDLTINLYKELDEKGKVNKSFNWQFFKTGDSREPEQAGIKGAVIGSLYTILVTLLLSFPVAVAAAIYLEEFAPKNRFIDFIEININNLAAVPSIVFGLLGLAVFINFFSLPRSAPLVGGIVLSLMTLPTIIIAARSAIKAVPPSLREAALGLGASKMQTVFHHVFPAALPGILTGTIIGMAQALGETAPLLMIGMVAFIVDIPQAITDPATVLPVQVFLWSDSTERGFLEKTSAAILILILFLIAMNALAIYLRKKFEKKW